MICISSNPLLKSNIYWSQTVIKDVDQPGCRLYLAIEAKDFEDALRINKIAVEALEGLPLGLIPLKPKDSTKPTVHISLSPTFFEDGEKIVLNETLEENKSWRPNAEGIVPDTVLGICECLERALTAFERE